MDATPPRNIIGNPVPEHQRDDEVQDVREGQVTSKEARDGDRCLLPEEARVGISQSPSTQQVTWITETWGFDGQRHFSFGIGF